MINVTPKINKIWSRKQLPHNYFALIIFYLFFETNKMVKYTLPDVLLLLLFVGSIFLPFPTKLVSPKTK